MSRRFNSLTIDLSTNSLRHAAPASHVNPALRLNFDAMGPNSPVERSKIARSEFLLPMITTLSSVSQRVGRSRPTSVTGKTNFCGGCDPSIAILKSSLSYCAKANRPSGENSGQCIPSELNARASAASSGNYYVMPNFKDRGHGMPIWVSENSSHCPRNCNCSSAPRPSTSPTRRIMARAWVDLQEAAAPSVLENTLARMPVATLLRNRDSEAYSTLPTIRVSSSSD